MKIILKDYEVKCCHGVNPEEKVQPQRFLFSAEVAVEGVKGDNIDDTVSYSAVKKAIKAYAEGHTFDLIETLADNIARLLLDSFPLALGVKVTVKKPDAPMSGIFDYVAVEADRKWRRAFLSLGSSLGDKNAALDLAVAELKSSKGIKDVKESSRIITSPYGGVAKEDFLNSAVEIYTYLSPLELLDRVHEIEFKGGRARNKRWEDRTLDIDILLYGDEVIDKNGLLIPHIDMINRDFVLIPLAELAPYAIHPIYKKTIKQLLDGLNGKA